MAFAMTMGSIATPTQGTKTGQTGVGPSPDDEREHLVSKEVSRDVEVSRCEGGDVGRSLLGLEVQNGRCLGLLGLLGLGLRQVSRGKEGLKGGV